MESCRTLVIAIIHGEINVIAEEMNSLLGNWLEGCYDEFGSDTYSLAAQLQFKACWKMLKDNQRQAVLDLCPFESFANEMAEENGLEKPYVQKGVTEYGIPVWERIRSRSDCKTIDGAISEITEFLDHTLWLRAREYRKEKETNKK